MSYVQDRLSLIASGANMFTGRDYPPAIRFRAGRLERVARWYMQRSVVPIGAMDSLSRAIRALSRSKTEKQA